MFGIIWLKTKASFPHKYSINIENFSENKLNPTRTAKA
jgi:hypothetical protein